MKPARVKQEQISTIHILEKARPEAADVVKGIQPYEPVSSLPRIVERPEIEHFKLDWNECTIPPAPGVKKAIHQYLDGELGLNIYPELFSYNLRLKLQSYVGYPADHILVSNGSDDALDLICKTYLNPGDRVLSPYPTYTHFLLFAKSRGAIIDKVIFEDAFKMDIEDILAHVTPETKIIYLVNPNNPTGVLYDEQDVEKLIQAAPQAIILVDEAYAEFARASLIDLVAKHENVFITRTFSKLFGLAGLRVGYLVAQPNAIKELSRLYNPKSVNQIAQVAAGAALDDLDYYERYIDEVDRSKRLLGRWCESHGLEYFWTPANYVMVRVENVKEVVEALADKGVYVRDRSSFPQLNGCFRLNLGTVEQTSTVILRFEAVLKELGQLQD